MSASETKNLDQDVEQRASDGVYIPVESWLCDTNGRYEKRFPSIAAARRYGQEVCQSNPAQTTDLGLMVEVVVMYGIYFPILTR